MEGGKGASGSTAMQESTDRRSRSVFKELTEALGVYRKGNQKQGLGVCMAGEST